MAHSPDPRYRLLNKSIIGGVFTCAIGFFLVSDGTALLAGIDPMFARFRDLAYWIGWFFVATGAFNIVRSVAGLFKLDRENRSARKAAGKPAEAQEMPAENSGETSNVLAGWLFAGGIFLLLGFHNMIGLSSSFTAKYDRYIYWVGWSLVALALLGNARQILGLIKAGLALLRSEAPAQKTSEPGAKHAPEPTPPPPPTSSSPAATKEKPKHVRRPIIERRR